MALSETRIWVPWTTGQPDALPLGVTAHPCGGDQAALPPGFTLPVFQLPFACDVTDGAFYATDDQFLPTGSALSHGLRCGAVSAGEFAVTVDRVSGEFVRIDRAGLTRLGVFSPESRSA